LSVMNGVGACESEEEPKRSHRRPSPACDPPRAWSGNKIRPSRPSRPPRRRPGGLPSLAASDPAAAPASSCSGGAWLGRCAVGGLRGGGGRAVGGVQGVARFFSPACACFRMISVNSPSSSLQHVHVTLTLCKVRFRLLWPVPSHRMRTGCLDSSRLSAFVDSLGAAFALSLLEPRPATGCESVWNPRRGLRKASQVSQAARAEPAPYRRSLRRRVDAGAERAGKHTFQTSRIRRC
jgi:hypothetical protein